MSLVSKKTWCFACAKGSMKHVKADKQFYTLECGSCLARVETLLVGIAAGIKRYRNGTEKWILGEKKEGNNE